MGSPLHRLRRYWRPDGLAGVQCAPCPVGAHCEGGLRMPYVVAALPSHAQTTPAAARTHARMARAPALCTRARTRACVHTRSHHSARAHARPCRYPEVDYYAASANGSLLGFPIAPDAQALWASVEESRGIFRPCAPAMNRPGPLA